MDPEMVSTLCLIKMILSGRSFVDYFIWMYLHSFVPCRVISLSYVVDVLQARADFLCRVKAYERAYEGIEDNEDDGHIRYVMMMH